MNEETQKEFNTFLEKWTDTPEQNKKAFLRLRDHLAAKAGVELDFKARPGVTYSLRGVHENQKDKDLFVMADVIEDEPRWLSVCFYGEMVKDPDELGDFVPEGLLGEDAMCFDVDSWDEELLQYIEVRLDEAAESAAKG
ncbi:hypothetical protein DENIS_4320 [Desulfonema ishimotonii]|uniref:Uncharacterized protein n=1 Tax=Desulfonema ishimotonii TaxID=45657 RepID=A0A401G295_9BACT|nr:hypothetical protein [Desulfonema ishimotonii]GBC63326.1 hypothetical protein DENIS_4320 [Desulfonema ishimotonii]